MTPRAGVVLALLVLVAGAWWLARALETAPPAIPRPTTTSNPSADAQAGSLVNGATARAEPVSREASSVERQAASTDAPTTGEVLVTVRFGEDQLPAPDVEVYLGQRGVEPHLWPRDRTDAEGRVLFADLAPGSVRPVAGHEMLRTGADRFDVVAGQRHEVVIDLKPGMTITGRVVDDVGTPVADADVVGASWGGGETEVVGRTAADGTFRVRSVSPIGHYGARKRGHVPSSMRTITAEAGAEVALQIVLSRGGGTLTGTVLGPDGAPVEGALVRAGSPEQGNHKLPDGASAMAPQPEQMRTDAQGRFAFASVVPGTVPLAVWSMGLAPCSQDVEVVAGRTNDVTVHLVPGATLVGTVKSASGEPAAAADVRIGDHRMLGRRYLDTAGDGTFRLEGLPLGEQKVTVRHDEHGRAEATFEFVAGETRRWDVVLDPGEVVKGRVLDSDGKPVSMVIIEAQLDPGRTGDRWFGHADAGDDGRFVIRNCLPGRTIKITFRRKMFTELSVRDVLPGPEERTFRLPEEHWVHIEGTARGPDGEVIAGVQLSPHLDSDNSGTPVETVDPQTGAFRLGPYPPGPYSLRLSADGYPTIHVQRTLAPDETWDLGEVRFQPGGTLALQLVATDGVSVDRVRVGIYDAARGTWLTSVRAEAGSARSEPLLPGDYELVFTGDIAAQRVPFSIRAGVETKLDVQVTGGAQVTVNCAPPAGEPPRSIPIVVANATGIVWRGSLWRRGDVFTTTVSLGPGSYTVTATSGELGAEQTFTVGDEAPEVTLTLAPR